MERYQAKRLAKLGTYMRTIDDRQFYLGGWIDGDEYNLPLMEDVKAAGLKEGGSVTANALNVCGTTACLLGHAATMPEFRKRGLKLVVYDVDTSYDYDGDRYIESGKADICGGVHLYDEGSDYLLTDDAIEAGMEFFGLTSEDANALFTTRGYDGLEYDEVKPYHTIDLIIAMLCAHGYDDIAETV